MGQRIRKSESHRDTEDKQRHRRQTKTQRGGGVAERGREAKVSKQIMQRCADRYKNPAKRKAQKDSQRQSEERQRPHGHTNETREK